MTASITNALRGLHFSNFENPIVQLKKTEVILCIALAALAGVVFCWIAYRFFYASKREHIEVLSPPPVQLEEQGVPVSQQQEKKDLAEEFQVQMSSKFSALRRKTKELEISYCIDYGDNTQNVVNHCDGYSPPKNRYSNIQCPVDTVIKIPTGAGELGLHANRVDFSLNSYICTQAPTPETCGLFWASVFHHSELVVDLTNLEGDRSGFSPVISYYPASGETRTYCLIQASQEPSELPLMKEDTIQVRHLSETATPDGRIVQYMLYFPVIEDGKLVTKEKKVIRYHFQKWPDGTALSLEKMSDLVDSARTIAADFHHSPSKPVTVHCRAGVGRTGTFAVIYAIIEMKLAGKIKTINEMPQASEEDVELARASLHEFIDDMILTGRHQRGEVFVQTVEQYSLIHAFADRLFDCKS